MALGGIEYARMHWDGQNLKEKLRRFKQQMYPHNLDDHGNLKPGSLRPSHITLTAYGDSQIKRHGTVTIPCSYEQTSLCHRHPTPSNHRPSFLGLADYMDSFIPNLSVPKAPLRERLKEENPFKWSQGTKSPSVRSRQSAAKSLRHTLIQRNNPFVKLILS